MKNFVKLNIHTYQSSIRQAVYEQNKDIKINWSTESNRFQISSTSYCHSASINCVFKRWVGCGKITRSSGNYYL